MIDEFANCLAAMGCGHPRSHAVLICEVLPELLGGLVIQCPQCRANLDVKTMLNSGMCSLCGQRITSLRVQPTSSTVRDVTPTATSSSNGGPASCEQRSDGTAPRTGLPSPSPSSSSSVKRTDPATTTGSTRSATSSSLSAKFTVTVATDSRERTAAEIERHLSVVLHKPVTVD